MFNLSSYPIIVYTQSTTPTDVTSGRLWVNTTTDNLYVANGIDYQLVADPITTQAIRPKYWLEMHNNTTETEKISYTIPAGFKFVLVLDTSQRLSLGFDTSDNFINISNSSWCSTAQTYDAALDVIIKKDGSTLETITTAAHSAGSRADSLYGSEVQYEFLEGEVFSINMKQANNNQCRIYMFGYLIKV